MTNAYHHVAIEVELKFDKERKEGGGKRLQEWEQGRGKRGSVVSKRGHV